MSTESSRNFTDLTGPADCIAARAGKLAASGASVDIRCVRAGEAPARQVHPYSSFQQGGVRRFDRSPFGRGPFEGHADLPLFRVS